MTQKVRRRILFGLSLVVVLGAWFFREPLRARITRGAVLANPAPPPELVEETLDAAPDHASAILAAWNTGKIVQRQVAIREIGRMPPGGPLPHGLERLLLAGALDVDMDVRESALGALRDRHHPALAALAAVQLHDPDPQVRLLGLNYLKGMSAAIGVPLALPLLDEEDPLIIATALSLLERWTGETFGVKLRNTAPVENEQTGLKEFPKGSLEKARAGAARAKAWWVEHRGNFSPAQIEVPQEAAAARKPVPAGDFALHTLDGRQLKLADLRGKVVLINFWTTWCPACVSEMPELIALQKRHGGRLAILGVSLDFVPDSHGHLGGHSASEEAADGNRNEVLLKRIREKVAQTARSRGINYPVVLDEQNEIGGRFNGGELPTTVIIDANGEVRRRFVGARSLPVFEAMLDEAERPEQNSALP